MRALQNMHPFPNQDFQFIRFDICKMDHLAKIVLSVRPECQLLEFLNSQRLPLNKRLSAHHRSVELLFSKPQQTFSWAQTQTQKMTA